MHEVINGVETGVVPITSLTLSNQPPRALQRFIGSVLRPTVKSEHTSILALMTRYVDSTRLPAREQLDVADAIRTEIASAPRTAVLTHSLVPAISKVIESCLRKHIQMRTLIAGLAAERYRRIHGEWPQSLADLTPGALAEVPIDPFYGQPLRLLHLPDGIVIYSVGIGGLDNNGRLGVGPPLRQPGFDIGVRLWNPSERPRATHTESGARR
jgi:hypothetical protein